MARKKKDWIRKVVLFIVLCVFGAGLWYGLANLNRAMAVRYQAVGEVRDEQGNPLEGVEIVLTLVPPPSVGPARDALFRRDGRKRGRVGSGWLYRGVGPVVGLSDSTGGVIVRAVGRLGAAHAIRLGVDSSGEPPFEVAWIAMRKEGYHEETVTMSILGWRPSPEEWGNFANRLPRLVLRKK